MHIFPAIGGAPFANNSKKVIRLIRKGCANRPFFLISVMEKKKEPYEPTIEQLGSYDPLPNKYNEKLVAINFKRLEHWLREGADVTVPVLKLLGLSGYFPIHPATFVEAWENRKKISKELEELGITAASENSSVSSSSLEKSSTVFEKSSEPSVDSSTLPFESSEPPKSKS